MILKTNGTSLLAAIAMPASVAFSWREKVLCIQGIFFLD